MFKKYYARIIELLITRLILVPQFVLTFLQYSNKYGNCLNTICEIIMQPFKDNVLGKILDNNIGHSMHLKSEDASDII